ncbi:MAG: hypothetical protein MJY95_04675 [Bacteroidaceae bacterium]|nr:hypothetical protein [Bacteroidaceae bacterium]
MKRKNLLLSLIVAIGFCANASAETIDSKTLENGGQGAYKALVCKESTLLDFTIYRPKDMAAAVEKQGKLPVLVWGNGACSNTNLGNELFLNEIASHGYVCVAIGPFLHNRDGFVDSGTDGSFLTRAVDWVMKQNNVTTSEYRGMLDTDKIAASGHSCGGAEAMSTSKDSRVKTIIMTNSGMGGMGMGGASPDNLNYLHGPILYIVGGPDDVAYGNAEQDYNNIKVNVPVCFMSANVGHGGTFHLAHGGDYSRIMIAWLDWFFKGKKEHLKLFRDCDPTGYSGWTVKSKNFNPEFEEENFAVLKKFNFLHTRTTLPNTNGSQTVKWTADDDLKTWCGLTTRVLSVKQLADGDEPVFAGYLTATITDLDKSKTSKIFRVTMAPDDKKAAYLAVYNDASTNSPRYALCADISGKTFETLASSKYLLDTKALAPLSGEMKEVSIARGKEDNQYFMVAADGNNEEENYGLCLLRSTDLIHWETTASIDFRQGKVAFSDSTASSRDYITNTYYERINYVRNPHLIWDQNANEGQGAFMIYYNVCSTRFTDKYPKLYYSYINDDFTMITQPRALYDAGTEIGGAAVEWNPYDSLYHIQYVINNVKKGTFTVNAASSPTSIGATWTAAKEAIITGEGVANGLDFVRKINDDNYNNYISIDGIDKIYGTNHVHEYSSKLIANTVSEPLNRPTFIQLTEEEASMLAAWDQVVSTLAEFKTLLPDYDTNEAVAFAENALKLTTVSELLPALTEALNRLATVDSIEDINLDKKQSAIYDLVGRKVGNKHNMQRGIYITNGKKVLVK